MNDFIEWLWSEVKQDIKQFPVWLELLVYTALVSIVCDALIYIIPNGIIAFLMLVGMFTLGFFVYCLRKYFSQKYEEK